MIEKILNLGELKLKDIINLSNNELQKIYDDLRQIYFFNPEEGSGCKYDSYVFSILRKTPDLKDKLNGQNYIRKDYIKNSKPIEAEIYDFDLKITSTCS